MSQDRTITLDEIKAEYAAASDSPGRRMDLVRGTMDLVLDVDAAALEAWLADCVRTEPDPIVRHEAVFVAGALVKYGLLEGDVSFPAIAHAAQTETSTVVRHESVEALSNYSRLESIQLCEDALTDAIEDVRSTAIISLERLSYGKGSEEVKAAALAALERARTPA